ncbi:MAG: BCCT family transporter, partial [Candidatus Rokuibacteriota bacterium]
QAADLITRVYNLITVQCGVLYLIDGAGTLAFLAFLAFGRYGGVVLGGEDSRTEFTTPSWVAMLFCAGVGAGLLYWAVIEWAYYIDAPPFGLAPRSTEAIEWAASYGLFHWGPTGWGLLCLPTLAIAYPYYARRIPYLRLSTAYISYLPGGVHSRRGRLIDFLFMINLIGGAGTSLGLSKPMIAASLAKLVGIEHDFALDVGVVVFCIAIFGTSAYLGLQKGFQRLANLNMLIALGLLVFVLAVGPTLFILKTGLNSLGLVLQNFIRMTTWTDPIRNSGFVEDWTVFYWAWWVAYGPFIGIFVTRISRGRSVRQVVLGMLTFGSLGSGAFFVVFGNFALHLELSGAAVPAFRAGRLFHRRRRLPRHHLRLRVLHACLGVDATTGGRREPGALEPRVLGLRPGRAADRADVHRGRPEGRPVDHHRRVAAADLRRPADEPVADEDAARGYAPDLTGRARSGAPSALTRPACLKPPRPRPRRRDPRGWRRPERASRSGTARAARCRPGRARSLP